MRHVEQTVLVDRHDLVVHGNAALLAGWRIRVDELDGNLLQRRIRPALHAQSESTVAAHQLHADQVVGSSLLGHTTLGGRLGQRILLHCRHGLERAHRVLAHLRRRNNNRLARIGSLVVGVLGVTRKNGVQLLRRDVHDGQLHESRRCLDQVGRLNQGHAQHVLLVDGKNAVADTHRRQLRHRRVRDDLLDENRLFGGIAPARQHKPEAFLAALQLKRLDCAFSELLRRAQQRHARRNRRRG